MTEIQKKKAKFSMLLSKIDKDLSSFDPMGLQEVDDYFKVLLNQGEIASYSMHIMTNPVTYNSEIQYFFSDALNTQARGRVGSAQYVHEPDLPDTEIDPDPEDELNFMDLFRSFK